MPRGFTNWRTGTVFIGSRNKADIMSGVNETVVKSKFVANNTIEYFTPDGRRIIRYHDTDIITFHTNGTIELNTNGWTTRTTKDRLNKFLKDYSFWQEKKKWYIFNLKTGSTIPYEDGIILPVKAEPKWRM